MNDPTSLKGRYAQLVGYGPTNDIIGCINSYDAHNNVYEVHYPVGSTMSTLRVKPSQMQLFGPKAFVFLHPNAPVVEGNYLMTEIPVGSVVDLTNAVSTAPPKQMPILRIRGSCSLINRSTHRNPHHKFTGGVVIDVASAEDVVEFEDIRFEPEVSDRIVTCNRGKIVFRRCTFSGNDIGVYIGNATKENDLDANQVTFESCTFCGVKECSVLIHGGLVMIVNCTFEDGGIGVSTTSSTFVNLSTFLRCVGGVVVPNIGQVLLQNCTFEAISDFCALAGNESALQLNTCKMADCTGDGVVVEGDETNATIEDCTIVRCRFCVRIGNGDVQVTIRRLVYRDYKIFGVYIAVDTKGSVNICESPTGTAGNMVIDLSGDACAILSNGKELSRSAQSIRLQEHRALTELEGFKFGYPLSAMGKRILHRNGIVAMHCVYCKRTAPQSEMFRKCAHCREARYCSKACQREHWKTHFVECYLLCLRSDILRCSGYVKCSKCGRVENQCCETLHSACRRCLNVFYCKRECQIEHWSEHKHECKPYSAKRMPL